jgi:hypothetical protein
VECYFHRKTVLATWEPAFTCLHPIARTAVGYPLQCREAREAGNTCGPDAHLFKSKDDSAPPRPVHYFRQ